MSPRKNEELSGLTGLRGLAALAVLVYHCHWFPLGFLGPDIFFFLSGTVLAHVYRNECRMGAFLWARVARLAPTCAVAVLLTLLVRPGHADQIAATALVVPLIWHFSFWLAPMWSLSVEAHLYLGFPMLLLVLPKVGPRTRLVGGTICLIGMVIPFLHGIAISGIAALLRGFFPFVAGMLLLPWTKRTLSASAVAVPFLELPLVRWLGDISLPLYLLQWAVLSVAHNRLLAIALTIGTAALVHYAVEAPGRRWLRSLPTPLAPAGPLRARSDRGRMARFPER